MASAATPPPGSSRRPREQGQGDTSVGAFRIGNEIGRGSFATVYKAVHVKSRSLVAVKSVHLQKLNKKLKDNLYSEIEILKGLHHPHIVALIDCQESSSHIHLVMEYCQLGDLSFFIKKRDKLASWPATTDMVRKYPNPSGGGGLNEVVVRHFLKQLASALEFLRAKNFIHRDVKPQNLLLIPSAQFLSKAQPETMPYSPSEKSLVPVVGIASLPMLKLADFGFARSLPATSLAETLCGSPLYMAPEILRYEKYDAKADLWSVGTVLFEMMVGRPPFRATNHVELLRKIERGDDRIKFPEEVTISDEMKHLIKGLLKRNPVERIGFKDFFDHTVVKDEIPGVVDEDKPKEREPDTAPQESQRESTQTPAPPIGRRKSSFARDPRSQGTDREREREPKFEEAREYQERPSGRTTPAPTGDKKEPVTPSLTSTQPRNAVQGISSGRRPSLETRRFSRDYNSPSPTKDRGDGLVSPVRPGVPHSYTTPAHIQRHTPEKSPISAAGMEKQASQKTASPGSSFLVQQQRDRRQSDKVNASQQRHQAEQDVAFERDYVLVEKKVVEINALADEIAASPSSRAEVRNSATPASPGPSGTVRTTMTRRVTTPAAPLSAARDQPTTTQAIAITGRQRRDPHHPPRSSIESRFGVSPGKSATSAISKALNMASIRFWGYNFSPPMGMGGKGPGHSPPPSYGAFPPYPTNHGSLVMVAGNGMAVTDKPGDLAGAGGEDGRAVHAIEEAATRSDVVYGFAEVKFRQLIPMTPSVDHLGIVSDGPGKHADEAVVDEEGLTVDAVVTLSEEALVLYVKALSLLAKSMDIAGAWWSRKNRGEVLGESPRSTSDAGSSPSSHTSATTAAAGNRINNVVQWVRNRFNEVLEKAEFVRLKLIEAQKQLPSSHPSHPSQHPMASASVAGMGSSADRVVVSSGITAEKLMYDRALEMSRAAAVSELVGDNLGECEIAYVTAVRMLEAVLDGEDEDVGGRHGKGGKGAGSWVEEDDRKVVEKFILSIRGRLSTLRKKMAVIAKRNSQLQASGTNPAVGNTPPK